ncbi:MAG: GNAT family N-acetyltransferase [Actinomycetota bacterium]|nr:GNAT family N-acetyltransferase [Actinomycetota bacterium]
MTAAESSTPTTGTSSANEDAESHIAGSATLSDGTEVRIRHVTRRDESALLGFMQRLSPESRRLRFFSPAYDLESAARWAASADGTDHLGLVALGSHGQILGHAACVRMYGPRAEIAVEIDESCRHQGLATLLITGLAHEAEQKRIRSFVAEVLPENVQMLAVFHDGFDASRHFQDGEVDIEFPTAAWRLPQNPPC